MRGLAAVVSGKWCGESAAGSQMAAGAKGWPAWMVTKWGWLVRRVHSWKPSAGTRQRRWVNAVLNGCLSRMDSLRALVRGG